MSTVLTVQHGPGQPVVSRFPPGGMPSAKWVAPHLQVIPQGQSRVSPAGTYMPVLAQSENSSGGVACPTDRPLGLVVTVDVQIRKILVPDAK